MVNYLRRLRTFALFSLFCSYSFSQSTCATAQAICSNPGNNIIPASTGAGNAAPGPNYGCLTTQPNPSWSFIQIQTSGNISLQMSGSAGGDIDFIAYGPFASLATACSNLTAGNTAGCSYSGASVETFNLVGAVAGQFYIILNTNFSNAVQNIVFNQTGGSGSISCVNVCNITGMVNSPGACSPATNQYNLTGTLSTSGLPTAGSLTITNSCGGTPIVLTAPYTAPITYTFNNLPSNGATCSVTARFSTMTT
jgi:hypothetical protein